MEAANTATITQSNPIHTGVYAAGLATACALLGWHVMRDGDLTPSSGTGYMLGLAGGLMMLALLAYPLRKRIRIMRNWGPLKHWFRMHMLLGALGPALIIFHTNFHVGSLNAAVALICMLIVAGSGYVGRFIYRHIHHGLYGRQATLAELRTSFERTTVSMHRLHELAPQIEPRLHAFAQKAITVPAGLPARLGRLLILDFQARRVRRTCERELRTNLRQRAGLSPMSAGELRRQTQSARELILIYLEQVKQVAHFRTYERLFSLWHVLHAPLVYMLAASAVIHVVAAHMY
jgi:hypothetical protein